MLSLVQLSMHSLFHTFQEGTYSANWRLFKGSTEEKLKDASIFVESYLGVGIDIMTAMRSRCICGVLATASSLATL